ncbi:MAG: hypothetical protein HQL67_01860 [Magnetococcales bacterium]|nr:hypothetical protein [Magnetococcales bacterium]
MVLGRFSIIHFLDQLQARRLEKSQAQAQIEEGAILAGQPLKSSTEQSEPSASKLEMARQMGRATVANLMVIPAIIQRFFARLLENKQPAAAADWLAPMEADPIVRSSAERVEPDLDEFLSSDGLGSQEMVEPEFGASRWQEPVDSAPRYGFDARSEPQPEPFPFTDARVDSGEEERTFDFEEEESDFDEPENERGFFTESDNEDFLQVEPSEPDSDPDITLSSKPFMAEEIAPSSPPWPDEPALVEEVRNFKPASPTKPLAAESIEPVPAGPIKREEFNREPLPVLNLKPLEPPKMEAPSEPEPFVEPVEIPVNAPPPMERRSSTGTLESKEEEAVQDMPLPSLDMLTEPPLVRIGPSHEALSMKARLLEQKLADYKIKGQIVDVMPGPVVTTFELDPAPGLRASKVVTISDDLARSISAESVRVVGNVPGKTVIGIELPNEIRATVYLREVLLSKGFKKLNHPLAVALGSDINGTPFSANLAKMPHLLVAGTTGSGKSVAVNAMICSILFNARPDEVRFLMIDPKMLELSIYEGIPHLLAPVVTEVHKAANLLKWAVAEMEERYRLMSELGVRNLAGYNEKIELHIERDEQPTRRVKVGFDPETGAPVEQDEPIPLEKKPLIVIVIDELADLMIQVGKEVEPAIARLAQMARAAGLHLIIATQRPSVDVITGLIKANFPTRLAFQVSSKIDSRTILDSMGAERLLGMGDGLYQPPGTSLLKRIHAPFVSDAEVNDLVRYLKSTGKPEYNADVLVSRGEDGDGADLMGGDAGGVEEYDALYDQAAAVVIRAGKVSTSMVQRHFKIGYNRAARIVERMELDGLISAANGAGKREVLAPRGGGDDG